MEVAGAIVGSIVAKISEYAFEAVFNVRYNDNIKRLRVEVAKLESAKADVQNRIKEAELKAEDVYANVRDWMISVDAKTHQANTFLTEIEDEEKKKCSFFNFNPRLRLSKKAKNMRIELALIQQLGQFGQVSCPAPLPAPIINVNDYLSFKSRETIMKDILEALQNPYIKMIGVYGMGGIGKTQLVKQISNQVTQSKLFEPVILLTVGQRRDVNLVQQELAEILRLPSHINTLQGRAALLQKRLHKAEKKMILVIFDDIWDFLDFETVGIPSGDDNKGCKILVTSRYKQVLTRKMGIKKIFEVKGLNEQESWELFKITVDDKSIENDREKMPIATEIVNKCGNLPLAIVIVGKALQGEPLYTWRDALRQLKDPANVEIEGVSKHVYATLKWSYDHVKNPEAKSLFLLCSIFPDDHYIEIDELSTYAIGLKIIRGVDTLRTARDKILTMVDHLESSCLLQKDEIGSDGHQGVKMHDVVRDVAICIASTDNLMYTLSFMKGMDKWQDEKLRGGYTAIRVDCVGFEDLPLELSFPKLELLALLDKRSYREYNMLQIPEGYFGRMGRLKVLHLQEMCFSIPSSFDCLVNLRTLLLINCHLENIDTTGKLNNLEILDFSYSNVTELPLSLSQLSRLKQLKVSNCQQLEVIQPEVISRMTKLEELFLDNTFNDWEVGESNNCVQKEAKASISELGHLRYLTCLYLWVPDVRFLPEIQFLNNLELDRFQIVIGKINWPYYRESEKMLDIETDSRNDVWEELQLLERCEDLSLKGTCGVRNVVLKLKTSVYLRYLTLEDNEDVEYIVSELDDPNHDAFSILETLFLENMKRLETIINEGYSFKVFEKLKTLKIWGCDKMKYLFPVSIIEGLSNLQSIQIRNCEMLEAIVVEVENEAPVDQMEFRRLKWLELKSLPELKSFCGKLVKAKGLIERQSSEIVEEDHQIQSSEIQVSFPSLELLKIEDVHNLEVIWHNRLIVDDMSNLQSVKLDNCKSLKCIFTSNVMSALKRLDQLDIQNCDSLEQVFEIHQMIEPKEHRQVASINLRKLVLCNLPSLKHVWSNDPYEMYQFQDLNNVEVTKCPKLITLFPPSMARDPPHHLQHLQSNFDLERAKEEAQTLESVLVLEDNDFVIGKDKAKIPVSTLVGRNILFYFSADSSSVCRAFLPKLIEAYHKIKEKNDTFEVIFISSDTDESSFDQIFSRMPWLALPFGDPRKASVSRTFKVQSIPMLVAIGSDGRTVTKDVIDLIRIHGAEAYPFTLGRVGELEIEKEEIAKRGSEKVKHTLHEEHELVLSRRKVYICDGCNEEGRLWSYWCKECDFDLHPNCALEK